MLTVRSEPKQDRFNVIIETPKGSRNKFSYEPESRLFKLGKQLPAGAVFPYDFGFIPATRADDGDPIDVIVLLDTATFPGCLVRVRLVGVIDAEQSTRDGATVRNPRIVAVSTKSLEHKDIRRLSDLPPTLVADIEHFFVSYNEGTGKTFKVLGRGGRKTANRLARQTRVR